MFAVEDDRLYILGEGRQQRETRVVGKVGLSEDEKIAGPQNAPASGSARGINAYKYLVATNFASDPCGIANELRAQAGAWSSGFICVQSK